MDEYSNKNVSVIHGNLLKEYRIRFDFTAPKDQS